MQQVGSESEAHTEKMKRTQPPSIGSQDIPLTSLGDAEKGNFPSCSGLVWTLNLRLPLIRF
jgi:hypothetical protein